MKLDAFERELKGIHKELTVLPHPKITDLAGVYFQGVYLFGVPNHNIYDTPNSEYAVELPNGTRTRHRTRPEAIAMVKHQIEQLKFNPDNADAILGRGKYSEESLKADEEEPTILTPESYKLNE